MSYDRSALLLVGYQNDYFSFEGRLNKIVDASLRVNNVLENTIKLIEGIKDTTIPIIHTPICFSSDYAELSDPVGILKTVKEIKAFQEGTQGVETIPLIRQYGDRVLELHGKQGLNAFNNTDLKSVLDDKDIEHLVIVGVVTSVCIDSTGRFAHNLGYNVTILRDCTAGRTVFEQDYYCDRIFPIYASVLCYEDFIKKLNSVTQRDNPSRVAI